MPLPRNYTELENQKVRGFYLAEFAFRMQRAAQQASPDGAAITVYDCVLNDLLPLFVGGVSHAELSCILEIHNSRAIPHSPYDVGARTQAFEAMSAGLLCRLALQECLSLQNGWHQSLLSFQANGEILVTPGNFQQFAATPEHTWRQPSFNAYAVAHSGPLKPGLEYLEYLAEYAALPGRSREDSFRLDELFGRPYSEQPMLGMSDIFLLARALSCRVEVEEICRRHDPPVEVMPYLNVLAMTRGLPLPPAPPSP